MADTFFHQFPVALDIANGVFPLSFFEKLPFLITTRIRKKSEAPLISVERRLKRDDIERTVNFLVNEKSEAEKEEIEAFPFLNTGIADAKEYYIKQDLHLLVDLVDRYFDRELKNFCVDLGDIPSGVIQIVEIDWSLRDFQPAKEGSVHYEVFTKREIRMRSEPDG